MIVPVPQKVKVEHGEIITPKRAKELDLSNLTRDEILSELGKPTWDLFNSRVLVYRGGLDKGAFLWAVGGEGGQGGAGIADWVIESGLFMAFDQNGSCVGHSFEKGMVSPVKIYFEADRTPSSLPLKVRTLPDLT